MRKFWKLNRIPQKLNIPAAADFFFFFLTATDIWSPATYCTPVFLPSAWSRDPGISPGTARGHFSLFWHHVPLHQSVSVFPAVDPSY